MAGEPGGEVAAAEGGDVFCFFGPVVFSAEVGKEDDVSSFQGFAGFRAEVGDAACGEEEGVREEDAGDDGGLFGLNDTDGAGVGSEQMETEKALAEMEVGELGLVVDPGDSALRGFDAVTGVVVVEHNLARSYALLFINLPEDGGTRS